MLRAIKKVIVYVPTQYVAILLFMFLWFQRKIELFGVIIYFWMIMAAVLVGLYEMLRTEFKKDDL